MPLLVFYSRPILSLKCAGNGSNFAPNKGELRQLTRPPSSSGFRRRGKRLGHQDGREQFGHGDGPQRAAQPSLRPESDLREHTAADGIPPPPHPSPGHHRDGWRAMTSRPALIRCLSNTGVKPCEFDASYLFLTHPPLALVTTSLPETGDSSLFLSSLSLFSLLSPHGHRMGPATTDVCSQPSLFPTSCLSVKSFAVVLPSWSDTTFEVVGLTSIESIGSYFQHSLPQMRPMNQYGVKSNACHTDFSISLLVTFIFSFSPLALVPSYSLPLPSPPPLPRSHRYHLVISHLVLYPFVCRCHDCVLLVES